MKRFLICLAACALPAWCASVNSNTVAFDFTGTSQLLSFNQFDASLGTLTEVRFAFLSSSRVTVFGTPTDPFSGGCGGSYSGDLRATSGGGINTILTSLSGSLISSNCGTSSFFVNSLPTSQRQVSNAGNLSGFVGTGTLGVTLTRNLSATNINNLSATTEGSARLTYYYDVPVVEETPEPATWGLLAVGLAMGIRARRAHR